MGKRLTIADAVELLQVGTAEIIPEDGLEAKLRTAEKEGRPLRVKLGIDASGPDIHLGFAVVLRKLRQFQDHGHIAVLIVGDFTGKIGDPSGRKRTRPQLTDEQIQENLRSYQEQVFHILDPEHCEFRFNGEWCDPLTAADVIRLASQSTVARLLERDDFAQRFRENEPISLHELLYPIFQAYDSVAVKADIELGGTDQKFNILMGRQLQEAYGQKPQVVVLMPLLEGTDGVRKMSKSWGNYVGITETPREMFGKLMSIPDELIPRYFELAAWVSGAELDRVVQQLADPDINPRDLKARMAREVVAIYHSTEAAQQADKEFSRIFRKGGLPDDVPTVEIEWPDPVIWVVKLLTETAMVTSSSEARRLISQGGVYIDDQRVEDLGLQVPLNREILLRVGKRKFSRVRRKTK
jgi:tyrosyl-tRNA synthetase